MKPINWTKVLVISSIVLLALALVFNLFAPLLWRQLGGWNTYPSGYDSWGMMHGGNSSGMVGYHRPFWGLGMLISWLFPLGLLALLIAGMVWLVQAISRSSTSFPAASPAHACVHCGQPVQADWRNCPYCGTPLIEAQKA